ncbi:MAG: ankyrin repeat domain-containing protein, partial [Gammaproteobacteria bacterium]|nr:ankyrin repeat domain-containing protein [Gammaproteobacteria bacterium]
MKPLLLTTIAAVLLVGCATTQSPEPTAIKAPDISIHKAAGAGNIEAVKQHLAAGTDVNVKGGFADGTPLHYAAAN